MAIAEMGSSAGASVSLSVVIAEIGGYVRGIIFSGKIESLVSASFTNKF